ncbi:MAG: hypothetical protein KC464_15490, partial [Myxococcales bacterium]|nr:hypothetical protein [Myxococcales bacterium]
CAAADDGGVDTGVDAAAPVGHFRALAVGDRFACAITDGDELECWGDNRRGQLGDGTMTSRGWAAPIAVAGPWKEVGAGGHHACAVKTTGEVYCWGEDLAGQASGDIGGASPTPRPVVGTDTMRFDAVALGATHTCGLRDDRTVWCWGINSEDQLGDSSLGPGASPPHQVPGLIGVLALSAGDNLTCARRDNDHGVCWGDGAIGDGTGHAASPAEIGGGHLWLRLSVSSEHSCGVTTGGELWCWGGNFYGEVDTSDMERTTPVMARAGTSWTVPMANHTWSCGARSPSGLTCFGDGRNGQLGDGARSPPRSTAEVTGIGRVVAGGIGDGTTCVLDDTGVVWCWGLDDRGQVGDGAGDARFVGAAVVGVTGVPQYLTSTWDHTCALTEDGRAFCWGSNYRGQIGDGSHDDRNTAFEVPQPDGMPWTEISAGADHTCGISAGRLYCWGSDDYGQLGNGAGGSTPTPTRIAPATTWAEVTASVFRTCAIDNDSDRWCWGDTTYDGLGDNGTVIDPTSPTAMPAAPGPASWRQIIGGADHQCGVGAGTSDGELWCWGRGANGALGIPTPPATSPTPVQVGTATDWRSVGADVGFGTTCGVRDATGTGGALYCWGNNDSGQFGTGDPSPQYTPLLLDSGHAWVRVDLGWGFTCGIDAGSRLYCWGYNDAHQVSAGDDWVPTIRTSQVGAGSFFLELAVGFTHACAVDDADAIYCWGEGSWGRLGDGTVAHLTPSAVVEEAAGP